MPLLSVKTRISFGSGFKRPQKRALKLERNKKAPRLLTPKEIHKLLKVASVQMKAMILLGCNAGMGNSDLANLPLSALDLKTGWIDFPRPKTGADRPLRTVASCRLGLSLRCGRRWRPVRRVRLRGWRRRASL